MLDASMEPRSFNRGDPLMKAIHGMRYMLQWSHGHLTVVTGPYDPARFCPQALQWSHGHLTVVTAPWPPGCAGPSGFNGATVI